MLVSVISLLMPQKISAQSTVYFFIDKVCNLDVFMFKNSEPLFDMVGPITKKGKLNQQWCYLYVHKHHVKEKRYFMQQENQYLKWKPLTQTL